MIAAGNMEEIIDSTARDVAAAAPLVRTLMGSAARAFERGEIEDAGKLLGPTLKMLDHMSRLSVVLQRRLSACPKEAKQHAAGLAAAHERWAVLLQELSSSVKQGDFLKTADLLTYEFPPAFDQQTAYFSLLSELKL